MQKNLTYLNENLFLDESKTILTNFREQRSLRFTIIAYIIIGIVYATFAITIPFEIKLFYHVYVLCAAFGVYFVILFFIIKYKHKPTLQNWLKHFVFFMFYGIQTYWTVMAPIQTGEEFRFIRCIYVLQFITNFYISIFFNFHQYLVLAIGISNFGITLTFQILSQFNHLYIIELCLAIINPVVAMITRSEYDLVSSLTLQIKSHQDILTYGDNLISDFPLFFFTFSNHKIIYTNKAFNSFLKDQNIQSRQISTFRNIVSPNYTLAEDFLSKNKFSYIDPKLKAILSSGLTMKIEDANIFQILSFVQSSPQCLEFEKFYFLGINEGNNNTTTTISSSIDKLKFNVNFRIMKSTKKLWIEVLMTDVTLSQQMNLIEKFYTIRENLLSKIAHEFKTPLMSIVGLTEDISTNEALSIRDIQLQIQDVCNLSRYTLFLVTDIVNVLTKKTCPVNSVRRNPKSNISRCSNMYTDEFEIHKESFQVKDVLNFCFEILKTLLKYNKKKSNLIVPGLFCGLNVSLFSDSFRLKQILLNIISNAVKLTKSGYIKISSYLEAQIGNKGSSLIITVEDSGIGVPKGQIHCILSDKHLIDSFINDKEFESGLGLSISKLIANLMGWELRFSSSERTGSQVSICIPILHEDQIKQQENNFEEEKLIDMENSRLTSPKRFDFKHESFTNLFSARHQRLSEPNIERVSSLKHILIIDDNNLIIQSLCSLLKKCFVKNKLIDFDVITGYDGADLINEIIKDQSSGNKIILTLLDENMEYIDGNDALQMIRKLENKNRIKKNFVCKISAVLEVNEELCMLYDYCLNKPIKLEDIEKLFRLIQII